MNNMDVIIEKLSHHDLPKFVELIRLFEDVFEMEKFAMPDGQYLQELLEKDSFFVFVALLNDQVVGGLTSYIMPQYYSKRPLIYIYDLAVRTDLQRRGIGKMLIESNNRYGKVIGAEVVMVQADEPDDYAVKFYLSTGATAEKVIHFEYPLNHPTA
ncbi:MAG: hypothetical protein AVDCRST_MAG95-966 [uncultured Adhaeribacter sp.]|uniref:N-acetyltransferase domain-containing protein n=1 Tax=uncultured Adhaeribacter sp. TaxID=448109 RepID=A0A6J4HQE6_9BACT|nr:MAG: hypothetical protein AVDCRST_MAG95-966 [uncultured Adhaeribacter sp.]